jgi:DNA-binding beta-propeller fold protein YncE
MVTGNASDIGSILPAASDRISTPWSNPDCIVYDPASQLAFAMNGNSNTAAVINPRDGKVVSTIWLGGGPEFSVSDGRGNLLCKPKEPESVGSYRLHSLTVKDHWPLAPCEAPASLGLDPDNRRLFVGCRSKLLAVVAADQGHVVATYPIGDYDASVFDPETK